jgi:hypothetical protein
MASAQSTLAGWKNQTNRTVLVVIGLAVVVAGLLVPQMLPDTTHPHWPPPASSGKVMGSEGSASQPADAAGEGMTDYQPPTWPEAPDPRTLLLRLGLGTVVVLVLCVVVLRLCKNWLTGAAKPRAGDGSFQMVDTLHLGNRCWLHLVKVGTRQVLIGVDASGLKAMTPLADSFESTLTDLQGADSDLATVGMPPTTHKAA